MINFTDIYNNQDYKKISFKAISKFKKYIQPDELEQCRVIGMWTASLKYNGKSKISTFIYNNIVWECIKCYKESKKYSILPNKPFVTSNDLFNNLSVILNDNDYQLVHYKYIGNYTHKEIAGILKISKSKVQRRLNKIMSKLRYVLY